MSSAPPPSLGITPGLACESDRRSLRQHFGRRVLRQQLRGVPAPGREIAFSGPMSLTWVKGNHTFKFGVDIRRARFDQYYYFDVNGEYTFDNSGPNGIIPGDGDQYAEFLLGLADAYTQGSGQREDVRSTAAYPFVQDSWKIKPNFTLNYGLRWEYSPPLTDISGHVETFRPGTKFHRLSLRNSRHERATYWASLRRSESHLRQHRRRAHRLGRSRRSGRSRRNDFNVLQVLCPTHRHSLQSRPRSAKTSIRAGWGLFYNPIEELVLAQFGAEPPFGGSSSLSDVFFNTPFVNQGEFTAPESFRRHHHAHERPAHRFIVVSSHSSLRRIRASPALAIHHAIQPHHPARAEQQHDVPDRLRRIPGTSPAGYSRHQSLEPADLSRHHEQRAIGAGTCAPDRRAGQLRVPRPRMRNGA